jgi:AcrR family transcriptional regulator
MRQSKESWIMAADLLIRSAPDSTLTIDRIAGLVGATKGSFYHHFETRADLVLEIQRLQDIETEAFMGRADAVPDPVDRLRYFALDTFTSIPYLNAEGFLMSEELTDREVAKLGMRVGQTVDAWLRQLLIATSSQPDRALSFLAMMRSCYDGIVLSRRHQRRSWPVSDLEEVANALADCITRS